MGAGNGYWQFWDKKIGAVVLEFDSGETPTFNLVLGRNIREWQTGSTAIVNRASEVDEVWRGPISFAPSYDAVLDLLTIAVPQEYWSETLIEIRFFDTSTDTVKSYDPAIGVNGVSVGHR